MEGIFTLIGVLVVVALIVFVFMFLIVFPVVGGLNKVCPPPNSSRPSHDGKSEANRQARYQAELTAKAMKRPDGRLTAGDVIDTHLRHNK